MCQLKNQRRMGTLARQHYLQSQGVIPRERIRLVSHMPSPPAQEIQTPHRATASRTSRLGYRAAADRPPEHPRENGWLFGLRAGLPTRSSAAALDRSEIDRP